MQDTQVIVLATPVFFALIAIEMIVARRRGAAAYAWADTLNSIGLGMLSQLAGIFTKLLNFGIYVWVFERAALFELSPRSPWVWIGALFAYDLL